MTRLAAGYLAGCSTRPDGDPVARFHLDNGARLEERVFETFNHFHRRLEATRGLVAPDRFHEVRYEDLTKDPVGEVRRIYERLDLGAFDTARPHLDRYLAEMSRYERNKWQLSDAERAEIIATGARSSESTGMAKRPPGR